MFWDVLTSSDCKVKGISAAMKICDNIYLVGSGDSGFGLSNYLDCNVYLIDLGKDGLALIDAGVGLDTEQIVDEIKNDGFDPHRIRYVFLTHAHIDHSGGSFYFSKNFGAKVFGAVETAQMVSAADLDGMSFYAAVKAGAYPPGYNYAPCEVVSLMDNESLQLNDSISVKAISTPGHCIGHLCYLFSMGGKSVLFSGDLVFTKGKVLVENTWDCSIYNYSLSMQRIYKLKNETIFPAHGSWHIRRGYVMAELALKRFENLEVPAGF